MMSKDTSVRLGFIPLADAAPVIVAKELGFGEAEGLQLHLIKETSWATMRDRLAVGQFDAGHMLAPMPIASNLGLVPLSTPMVVPMALGTGANTISASVGFMVELEAAGHSPGQLDALSAITALTTVADQRKARGTERLKIGVVHPFSAHYYQVCYWLSAGGLRPNHDVELVIIPPSLMPSALEEGHVDAFCAGEPWGSIAVGTCQASVLTTNAHIWRSSPEKVLGVSKKWADTCPDALMRLVRAVYKAALWCDKPENAEALSVLLSRPDYLAQPIDQLRPSLSRQLLLPDGPKTIPGFLSFAQRAATFPWVSHALWFYSQMVFWKQAQHDVDTEARVRATYRPDIYRAAVAPLSVPLPAANSKQEGALKDVTAVGSAGGQLMLGPDVFFDGTVFDPDQIDAYITARRASDQR